MGAIASFLISNCLNLVWSRIKVEISKKKTKKTTTIQSNVSTSESVDQQTDIGEKEKKKEKKEEEKIDKTEYNIGYAFVNSKCEETCSVNDMKDHRP